jgi:hypothetical protein
MASVLTGPFNVVKPITPSDTVNLVMPSMRLLTDALLAGGAGTVAAVLQDGSVANLTVVAGQVVPIAAVRINATGTAATPLSACWQV